VTAKRIDITLGMLNPMLVPPEGRGFDTPDAD
jgi:hypothetical protein